MRATLSLLGLYNWDNSILDGLTLPSNFAAGDRDILINNLLIETAEFEILYTDPSFLKLAIMQWCNKRKSTWEWMKETQLFEYNPLWNENYNDDITRDLHGTLDATDLRTDNLQHAKTGTDTLTKTGTDTLTKTGSDTLKNTGNDTTKKTGNDTGLNSVYGFNQQGSAAPKDTTQITYNNQSKTDYDTQAKTTYDTEDKTTYNTENKTVYNNTLNDTGTQQQKLDHDTSDTGTIKRQVQGLHGAFPQEAIEKEQNLATLNLLDFIINDFKKRFCLLVY